MINLLAAYYENIGPFKGTCCSLFFDEGKYLIKAPIGSGKSFLFFDSPRYALYKDSSRNMLNLQSKNGEISLIFEVDSVYYLVKRILKSTKMGNDSCSSQLFLINYDGDNLLKDIKELTGSDELLQRNVNFLKLFDKESGNKWKAEEISFKNESDFQLALEDLLPPKEVFLSTVFLLQDADNIFEMRPADRLIVLKNVFNLLGIDDAKEKVQEKKKEVGYKLKALQDHSLQDEKLRTNLKGLRENIKELEKDHELQIILSSNDQFFYDIEGFLDQISLINFSLNGLDLESLTKSEKIVQEKIDAVVKLDTQISENEKQISSIGSQQKQVSDDIIKLKNNILDLQKKIESIDVKKGTELKNKKMQLFQKGNTINETADYSGLDDFISFWNENIIDREDIKRIEKPNNLKGVYDILQTAKEVGVQIKSEIEFKNSKLENLELQSKRWKENHDREIERLKELKSRKEEEIKQQQIRIKELDEMRAKNSDFDCPDLCKKCPHINAINKQQFEQYSQQKEKLNQILDSLKVDFDNESYDEKLKLMESEKNSAGDIEQIKIKDEIKKLMEFQNSLKDYLINIGFSDWEKTYHEWEGIQSDMQDLDKQLFKREEESKNLDVYQQEKIGAETSLKHLKQTISDLDEKIKELNTKIFGIKTEKEKNDIELLQNQQKQLKQVVQYVSQIEQLIEDNINNQNLTKQLQEDEKKLSRLYSILSKEIVLYALDGYLPVLSDIINGYLAQCVDYSIKMQIVENSEKLELDAKILDSKGEREVKSLSGGQRTILKLVWMLAISSYLRTPLLFLDETINNLDIDTVGKVSEMINNFVKQRTMKFYTVTHNKEIQDMQIWDDVIELN